MNNNQKVAFNSALNNIINDLNTESKLSYSGDDKTVKLSKLMKNVADASKLIDDSNKKCLENEMRKAKIDDLKEQQKIRYSEIWIEKLKIELERERINSQRDKDIRDAHLEEERIKLEYAKIKSEEAKAKQESKSEFIKTTATTIVKGAIEVIPVVSYVWLSLVGLKCELSGEAILPKVFTKTVDRLK